MLLRFIHTYNSHSVIAGISEECCHKLNMIPKWKSVIGFNKMKALVPAKRQDDFQKEVYGVIKEETTNYLPAKWISKFITPKAAQPFRGVSNEELVVYIGIDPPSHAVSCMGCCAIVYSAGERGTDGMRAGGGTVYIVGTAEVNIKESQMMQLSTVVSTFTVKVLEQLVTRDRPFKNLRVVPIVE